MAASVEELVVAIRGEGVDETTDQLEDMEDQFAETSGEVSDTAFTGWGSLLVALIPQA